MPFAIFYSLNLLKFIFFVYLYNFHSKPQDMKWFVKCIRNYATFSGRARRAEYWYFTLFQFIFMIVALCLDWMMFDAVVGSWFYKLTSLFLFLPGLAVSVRRLHDTGRSGKRLLWYYATGFVYSVALLVTGFSFIVALAQGNTAMQPSVAFIAVVLIGGLAMLIWAVCLLVWLCTAGTAGDNRYGSDPKAEIER